MEKTMAKSRKQATGKLVSWRQFIPDPLPYFAPQKWERRPEQTDAQWAATLQMEKRNRRMFTLALATFQTVATAYGYHKTCNKPECRRKGRCMGRRDLWRPNDDYARVLVPLCGTIDMAERVIDGVKEMCEIARTGRVPMFAADGSLHPGAEMLEDET
jgi:hypothetical protein